MRLFILRGNEFNTEKSTTKEKKTSRTVWNSCNYKQIQKKCLLHLRIFRNLVRHLASSTSPSLFLLWNVTATAWQQRAHLSSAELHASGFASAANKTCCTIETDLECSLSIPFLTTRWDSHKMWLNLQLYHVSFIASASNHCITCVVYRCWDFAFSHSAIFETKTPGTINWKEFFLQRPFFEKKKNCYYR